MVVGDVCAVGRFISEGWEEVSGADGRGSVESPECDTRSAVFVHRQGRRGGPGTGTRDRWFAGFDHRGPWDGVDVKGGQFLSLPHAQRQLDAWRSDYNHTTRDGQEPPRRPQRPVHLEHGSRPRQSRGRDDLTITASHRIVDVAGNRPDCHQGIPRLSHPKRSQQAVDWPCAVRR